jgi:two-component system, LuxR family, sensor kinase FixL
VQEVGVAQEYRFVPTGPKLSLAAAFPIPASLARRHIEIAITYLAGYVFLDWLSDVHPIANVNITPWNPPTGLTFAFILLFGLPFLPWLAVAPVLSDAVVRGPTLPLGAELAQALIIGGGYAAAMAFLLSKRIQFDPSLATPRSLLLLLVTTVVSTAAVTVAYVGMLVAFDVLSLVEAPRAALRFWVGEAIGVTVLTPFLLIVGTRGWVLKFSWELAGLLIVTLAALAAVFGFADTYRFQIFYIFFLPIAWTAVRFGLEGVSAALVIAQLGLMIAAHFAEPDAANVTAYQALLVVLAITGLAVGALVNEQQRIQRHLRLNQQALDRALRVSTMGEFAAALAHEINQPLTAIANYARVASTAQDAAVASQASEKMISQVERAAKVVQRLRDFIQLGRSEAGPIAIAQLLEEALTYCHAEPVSVELNVEANLPLVHADGLQLQQVIVNLVRNAVEAIAGAKRRDGSVVIDALRDGSNAILIRVRDNGPGFDPDLIDRASFPFTTSKEDGLGLGLSLARSIIEAHGGRLTISSTSSGATVSFTLLTR